MIEYIYYQTGVSYWAVNGEHFYNTVEQAALKGASLSTGIDLYDLQKTKDELEVWELLRVARNMLSELQGDYKDLVKLRKILNYWVNPKLN